MRSRYSDTVQRKHYVVIGGVVVVLLLIVLQLIYLNVVMRQDLLEYSRNKIERTITLFPKRGALYDRNGELLASSIQEYELWVDPLVVKDDDPSKITSLQNILHHCRDLGDYLAQQHTLKKRFVVLYARLGQSCATTSSNAYLSDSQATQVRMLKLRGARLNPVFRRYYPQKELFAQVLGYMNSTSPQDGIELLLNDSLKGKLGKSWVLLDGKGAVVDATHLEQSVQEGKDQTLTFDHRIQLYAYQALAHAVKKHKAQKGSVIVLNPKSGEVLSMVNYPSFNPNNWTQAEVATNYNYAIRDLLEYGSVIKPFTLAALLDHDAVALDEVIDVSAGYIEVGDRIFSDTKPLGRITLQQVISYSSNVGIISLVSRVSQQQLFQSLVQLSLADGVRSDLSLQKAVPLNLSSLEKGTSVLQASIAHGYSYSLSSLKLAQLYSILANRGVERPLRFVKQDRDAPARGIIRARPAVIETVNSMLESAVLSGTGKKAQVLPYRAAGKTGTARMIVPGTSEYSTKHYLASFAGFAPYEDPEILCVVTIYQPNGSSYYASEVAAPLFSKITRYALRLYGIHPGDATL